MTTPTHLAVLDDEVDITSLLGHYLQSQGFRVSTLHTGSALMELMGRDPPALVLLDRASGQTSPIGYGHDVFRTKRLHPVRTIRYKARDGLNIPA